MVQAKDRGESWRSRGAGVGRELDSEEARQALERAAHRIARKLLHAPLQKLRGEAEQERGPYYAEAVREIFELPEEDE